MGKPTYPNVRLEIDASDVSNLTSNHSGQAGVTTGWIADTGYTLSAVTNPVRSGNILAGTYTGGKTIAVTAASGRATTATVKSPVFAVSTGQWVGAQISIASTIPTSTNSKLLVYSAIQYLDVNSNQVGFLGYNIGDYVTEDQSIAGWSTVVFSPRPLQPTAAVPNPATQARLVFKFVRKDPTTEAITVPAETIYLTKTMTVMGDNAIKVADVPFADPGAVYQVITANVTSMQSYKGGDVNGVEDEMQVGQLTATLRDFNVDPNRNPRIRKNRLMRMTSPNTAGVWTPIFTGRLDHMTVSYVDKQNQTAPPTVTLSATDAIADATGTTAFYNYSGTLGQQVRAVIADSGTSIPYVTDAGTASTTKVLVDDNGKLWDQLTLIRNNTINAKLWVDNTNTIQCKTYTASTPLYTFTDRSRFKFINQIYGYGPGTSGPANPYFGYLHSDFSNWSVSASFSNPAGFGNTVLLRKDVNNFSAIPVRYNPYTGAQLGFYTSGSLGAQRGDRVSISIPVGAIGAIRARLTYGGLGSTTTTFVDLAAGASGTLNLNNVIASDNMKDTNGEWTDQVLLTVTDFGTDTAWSGTGDALKIGSSVAYNSGLTVIPSSVPVSPYVAAVEEFTWLGPNNQATASYFWSPGNYTPYIDAQIGFDNKLVVNQLTVTRHTSSETEGEKVYGPYINQNSVIAWGRVSANVDIIDGTAATLAADYLMKFQEPLIAPLSLTITYDHKTSNEHLMELYTPVRVMNNQSGLDKNYYIIGVEQKITGTRWLINYTFRPLDVQPSITVTNPPGGAATGPEDVFSNPGATGAVTNDYWVGACSTALTATATATDIVGATVTVPVGATTDVYLVLVTADISKTAAATTTNATTTLLVNGAAVSPAAQAIYRDDGANINRATVGQNFIITGQAAGSRIFKLQGAGAGYVFNTTHTNIKVIRLK